MLKYQESEKLVPQKIWTVPEYVSRWSSFRKTIVYNFMFNKNYLKCCVLKRMTRLLTTIRNFRSLFIHYICRQNMKFHFNWVAPYVVTKLNSRLYPTTHMLYVSCIPYFFYYSSTWKQKFDCIVTINFL